MINYAHKGACAYAPENTLSAFYLGLIQGANGFETDVCRTKDGHLVLFHDKELDRLTDGSGNLCDHTLEELKRLKIYGNSTTDFYDVIPTYREFLEHFAKYDIRFAIELSVDGLVDEVIDMSREFGIMEKATFTSFYFENLKRTKELDPNARVGYLVHDPSEGELEKLLAIGGEEICPRAMHITEESMKKWRDLGLGVRAWGVPGMKTMKRMCQLGVDGMTVDFPDRLFQYLCSHPEYNELREENRF